MLASGFASAAWRTYPDSPRWLVYASFALGLSVALPGWAWLAGRFGHDLRPRSERFMGLPAGIATPAKLRQVLVDLGCRNLHSAGGTITGKLGPSRWSWGEVISVTPTAEGLLLTSHSTFPGQIVDWGENRRNLDRFIDAWWVAGAKRT